VRSGPGAARTILLFHTISARPSKQAGMVGSTLGVYSFALIFVSARINKRHHHHHRGFIFAPRKLKRSNPADTGHVLQFPRSKHRSNEGKAGDP
jgi:hypothetical protein